MKRKYGGQRRSNSKRYKRAPVGRRSRGISSTGMLVRGKAGPSRGGSRKLRTLARKIDQINSICYPQITNNIIAGTTSDTVAKFQVFSVEKNLMDVLPDRQAKWTQNIRYNLFLQTSTVAQRVEVLIIKNKKTFSNATVALTDSATDLQDMSKTFLYSSGNRSDFKIMKTYSFVLEKDSAKGISGFFKTPFRSNEDWRDASNVANYVPKHSLFVLVRHCDINNPKKHSSITGQYNCTAFSYGNQRVV